MGLGPFQMGDLVRIPLEVTLNGVALSVSNPRVQRLVLPDGTSSASFPQAMTALKDGTYIYEFTPTMLGNYLAIVQGEMGVDTLEQIESFMVEYPPFGYPKIEIATDT